MIHDLCKLAFRPTCSEISGDISDDEDQYTSEEVSMSLRSITKKEKRSFCEFIKYLIDISQSLGPVKLRLDSDTTTDPTRPDEEDCGVQIHESILTVKDSFGKTPFHILCEHSADIEVMRVVLESTRESSQNPSAPTVSSLVCAKDLRGATPLHYLAYSRQCSFSSLQLMMDYCKPPLDPNNADPTLCTDIDGMTPLHWACDGYVSPRRIGQLLRHTKDSLRIQSSTGRRPFDQFVWNFVDSSWKVHELVGRELWDNIQEYLKVTAKKECRGEEEWLPLHMLAGSSFNFPSVFLDMALHYNKEDVSKPNSKGLLPLHLACARKCSNPSCDGTVAKKILQSYPQASYKQVGGNKRQRMSIHLALGSRKPMSLISALVKAYPNSLNIKDPVTGLWPFLLAGADNEDNVETSYSLLRADPSIVQVAIKSSISRRPAEARYADEFEEQSSRRLRTLNLHGAPSWEAIIC